MPDKKYIYHWTIDIYYVPLMVNGPSGRETQHRENIVEKDGFTLIGVHKVKDLALLGSLSALQRQPQF